MTPGPTSLRLSSLARHLHLGWGEAGGLCCVYHPSSGTPAPPRWQAFHPPWAGPLGTKAMSGPVGHASGRCDGSASPREASSSVYPWPAAGHCWSLLVPAAPCGLSCTSRTRPPGEKAGLCIDPCAVPIEHLEVPRGSFSGKPVSPAVSSGQWGPGAAPYQLH